MTQRPLDVRICCPKCGSTHFVLQEFRQYYAGIYSSVPGGEISDLGKGVNVRVCLCGHPVPTSGTRTLPRESRAAFQQSLESATRFRDQTELQQVLARLKERFLSRKESENTADAVKNLSETIRAFKEDE
jgi:hypothetical protein